MTRLRAKIIYWSLVIPAIILAVGVTIWIYPK